MVEQRPDPKGNADAGLTERPRADVPDRPQAAEDNSKVTPRLSVEEHLAGLWKVLGLGD